MLEVSSVLTCTYNNTIHHSNFYTKKKGGGFCTDVADCADRATGYLGSTASDGATMEFKSTAYFSTNPVTNPLLHNFTKVYVRYCDGAGRNKQPPLATHNLLENTNGVLRSLLGGCVRERMCVRGSEHCSRGGTLLPCTYADARVHIH